MTTTTTTSLLSSASYSTAQRQKKKADKKKNGKVSLAPKPAKNNSLGKGSRRHTKGDDQVLFKAGHSADQRGSQQPRKLKNKNATSTKKTHQPSQPQSDVPLESEFSEATLRQTSVFPTRKELPKMPPNAFENPTRLFANALEALGATAKWEEVASMVSESGTPYRRAQCVVQIPGLGELVANGDGSFQQLAERAACLHALAKMHEAGLLSVIWSKAKLTRQEVQCEKDSILDVFHYAARYGCIPRISLQLYGATRLISIEMPEHDIRATVRVHGSLEMAYVLGVREFKKQAELYELGKGTGSLAAKDVTALSATNAAQFFELCKDLGETVGRAKVEIKGRSDGKDGFVGILMLDGLALGPPTPKLRSADTATKLSYLAGALFLSKEKPHLLEEFNKALRAGNGQYLGKHPPVDAVVSAESLAEMQGLNQFARRYRATGDEGPHDQDKEPAQRMRRMHALTERQLAERSAELQKRMEAYQNRIDLAQLRKTRSELPMSQYAPRVLDIVQNNTYCVIIGATGSGKTTQVPQILLEHAIANGSGASCNVICTQPRRIAATSVAKRVAEERAEKLQDTVGYHVRFDAKLPKRGGSILYCTTGILLQQLQHAPDEVYDTASYLVIDEVHERDMPIDFLLIMLKKTMAARVAQGKKVPQVVLMSATIDAERFAAYFRDSLPSDKATDCPTLSVPGRTFPVTERYLGNVLQELENKYQKSELRLLTLDKPTMEYLKAEQDGLDNGSVDEASNQESVIDWKRQVVTGGDDALADNKDDALVPLGLAATTIAHVAKTTENGAILVFLPGLDEIVKLDEMLRDTNPLGVNFNDGQRFKIFMLHSSIQESQRTVFDALPAGCRKIILSTNIAETSVTIPDVQFVIDTGKSREKRYDQMRRITQLQCTWISKSNAKQRAGRAGRVQNGNYYALYTRSRHESMRAIGLPELLRSDLQEICLDVKSQAFKMPVRDFLAEAIEPPSPAAVDAAMRSLTALDALTEEDEKLTPLGRLLASLPVHPALGKMIVLGIIFRCLDPMIVLGAAAQERPLFVSPPDKKHDVDIVKQNFARDSGSDHILLLNAFRTAREASARSGLGSGEVLSRYYIHHGAFRSIDSTAREIEGILNKAGLIQTRDQEGTLQYGGKRLNENSDSEEMIKALLVAGLHPNVAAQRSGKIFRTSAEKFTFIHPGSVNARKAESVKLLAFTSLALSADGGRKNLRDTTVVNPLMVLLFGGRFSSRDGPILEIDNWLRFFVKTDRSGVDRTHASTLFFFHKTIRDMLAAAFGDLAKQESLADDLLRENLANGLARILTREVGGQVPRKSMHFTASGHRETSPSARSALASRDIRNTREHSIHRQNSPVRFGELGQNTRERFIRRQSPPVRFGELGQTTRESFIRRQSPPGRPGGLDYLREVQRRPKSPDYAQKPRGHSDSRWDPQERSSKGSREFDW